MAQERDGVLAMIPGELDKLIYQVLFLRSGALLVSGAELFGYFPLARLMHVHRFPSS